MNPAVNSNNLANPEPLSFKGRIMALSLLMLLITMWVLGIHAYLTLPDMVPTHFDAQGRPTSYGKKEVYLILPLAFSPLPAIFLVITRYRFTLINKYPYLINLPAFFANIHRIPSEQRGLWVNRYFDALLALGVTLSAYMLLLEWGIYEGALHGSLPSWFNLTAVITPFAVILIFLYYMRKLSREIEAAT
ncbi:hypothetical protein Asulf_00677 [Archaeoglobus sulfaticallidus PM70-1]|uniref:DUF1648 domain-containing protein n=1 Tax=Archaeoglobus sulfaticallidus PM70-1 TaxID=387631 RepID=N0BKH9_9EURY|nr:DUF1648 domain-containing protein [Archaeoglobus sulfaticallidus]AGK60695.1 hypothetical protein Asulf_00677 [Archaeoglobus sulfaticallidus PM70-1]